MIEFLKETGFYAKHFDYYLANAVVICLSIRFSKDLVKVAKGYDEKFQKEEITWMVSLYLFIFFALRIIFLAPSLGEFLLASLVASLGIASHFSHKRKEATNGDKKPPKILD